MERWCFDVVFLLLGCDISLEDTDFTMWDDDDFLCTDDDEDEEDEDDFDDFFLCDDDFDDFGDFKADKSWPEVDCFAISSEETCNSEADFGRPVDGTMSERSDGGGGGALSGLGGSLAAGTSEEGFISMSVAKNPSSSRSDGAADPAGGSTTTTICGFLSGTRWW